MKVYEVSVAGCTVMKLEASRADEALGFVLDCCNWPVAVEGYESAVASDNLVRNVDEFFNAGVRVRRVKRDEVKS